MLKEALILKTSINVNVIKEYLFRAQAIARAKKEGISNQEIKAIEEGKSQLGTNNERTNSAETKGRMTAKHETMGTQFRYTAGSKTFEKILSTRAIQMGLEFGITAEYICQQAGEQTCIDFTDLFRLFDLCQHSLYSSDDTNLKAIQHQSSVHAGSKSLDEMSDIQSARFTYEESILVTALGENYLQFIN